MTFEKKEKQKQQQAGGTHLHQATREENRMEKWRQRSIQDS